MMSEVTQRTPADPNELAAASVTEAPEDQEPGKNPAAVALSRLGALEGCKARAKKLSAKRLRR